jgi:zinc and cadmium transporter
MTFFLIIIFCLLGSVFSLGLASVFLFFPEGIRRRLLPALISYAAGTLLGAAFLGMIPEALGSKTDPESILLSVLAGIVAFLILEKLVLWRHCHKAGCTVHGATGPLILFGDALHNFIDGVVIAGAFLVSVPAGVAVSIATIAHEIPQEVGDFALLIDYGYSRKRALVYNFLSSVTTLAGGALAYAALSSLTSWIPYVLSISAASFIYIALADILPGLQKRLDRRESLVQFALLTAGIGTIVLVHGFN